MGQTKGCYLIRLKGDEAELTYSITAPSLIIADHRSVPDSLRGRGAGLAMVTRLAQDARAERVKIVPLCPFVSATPKKHPEGAGVFV